MQCSVDEESLAPTPIPSDSSAPVVTSTPTPTPNPIVLPPGIVNGEVFSQTVASVETVSDTRKLMPLNEGGMLTVQSDGVYLTEKRRVEPRKLIGLDAKLATPMGAEASGNGQTIVVYTDRYLQVSWDAGATWLPVKEVNYYSSGRLIQQVSISDSANAVLMMGSGTATAPQTQGDPGCQL